MSHDEFPIFDVSYPQAAAAAGWRSNPCGRGSGVKSSEGSRAALVKPELVPPDRTRCEVVTLPS